ncbi:sigma-70 family RNA polymerase sigma factor [bacterium]|nr:sigma-70 family RNA polymerase sigma factor [bacterium]
MAEQDIDFEKIKINLLKLKNVNNNAEKLKLENEIIVEAVPLVRKIASHLARRSTDPIEDILQIGLLGLMKAVKLFDFKVSSNFKTYATYFITGEIRHYLRDKVSMIKVPREIYELTYRVNKIIKEFQESGEIFPSEKEIAKELDTPVNKIREVMDIERRKHIVSLDQILSYIDADGQSLSEKIPNTKYFSQEEYQENRIFVKEAIEKLDDNLKEVIKLNFIQDISQTKIAEMLGISQMQVSRRIKKALQKLFTILNE